MICPWSLPPLAGEAKNRVLNSDPSPRGEEQAALVVGVIAGLFVSEATSCLCASSCGFVVKVTTNLRRNLWPGHFVNSFNRESGRIAGVVLEPFL